MRETIFTPDVIATGRAMLERAKPWPHLNRVQCNLKTTQAYFKHDNTPVTEERANAIMTMLHLAFGGAEELYLEVAALQLREASLLGALSDVARADSIEEARAIAEAHLEAAP